VRTGFRLILESEKGINVVSQAGDVQEHQSDVVLMDVQLPVLDSLDATNFLDNDEASTAAS
jgi:CheY-like chemotaxis protein